MKNHIGENQPIELGQDTKLKRVLPLSFLIFYGIAYLSPTSVFGTYGLVQNMTHGMIVLTYLVATFAMALTAYSYKQMAAAFPIAGSAYSYVRKAVSPYLGFVCGWAILIDYLLLPMICYLLAGMYMEAYFPGVPLWVWVIALILIVSAVNYFGIKMTAWVNTTIDLIQYVFMAAFIIFMVKWIVSGDDALALVDFTAVYNSVEFGQDGMGWGTILSGASILALAFLGFDSVSTLSEEAVNPRRNIGLAILIVCIGCGLFNAFVAYLMQLSWPAGWYEFASVDTGAQELVIKVCGPIMGYLFTATYVIACVACALAAQTSATRILFGMGRDNLLPKKIFAHLHKKHKTPVYNIGIITILSLSAIFLNLDIAISLINFGALLGFVMVNVSVIAHYYIREKRRGLKGLKYLIPPIVGAGFCFSIWISLDTYSKTLGFIWLGIGVVYLAMITKFFKKLPPEMDLSE